MMRVNADKQKKGRAPAKSKRAASPKKKPAQSVKQATLAKEAASDLEVSLSDAEEQKQQVSTSLEDAGMFPITSSLHKCMASAG